jgi:sigma-B regulation protein RsbQ
MTLTTPVSGSDVLHRNNVTLSGNPTGRPIVFVHGFGCSQEMWHAVTPHFEADHRVVLIDLVGAGGSDVTAYDLSSTTRCTGTPTTSSRSWRPSTCATRSTSGTPSAATIGVLAETTDASRFGALVLVAPSPRYIDDDEYRGGFERADIEGLLDALDANYFGWSQTMAPLIMGNAERPDLGRQLTDSFCTVDPEIARHFARVTFLSDNRRDLSAVRTRTLVLQCSDDVIAPATVGRYVHEQISTSRLVQLAATGHCPNLSAPDELTQAITEFIR